MLPSPLPNKCSISSHEDGNLLKSQIVSPNIWEYDKLHIERIMRKQSHLILQYLPFRADALLQQFILVHSLSVVAELTSKSCTAKQRKLPNKRKHDYSKYDQSYIYMHAQRHTDWKALQYPNQHVYWHFFF